MHYGETQPHQIYTFHAYSDAIHIFITGGDNRLCSFTNQGKLCADVLRKLLMREVAVLRQTPLAVVLAVHLS